MCLLRIHRPRRPLLSQQYPPHASSLKTIHRIVFLTLLTLSGFESLTFDFNEKIKGNSLRNYLLFFGGEQGIRTLEAVLATYTISTRAPSTSSDNSPYLPYSFSIITNNSLKIKYIFKFNSAFAPS